MPSSRTKEWQTVYANGVGNFRVPTEWVVEQEDRAIYITDRPLKEGEYELYIIGHVWGYVRDSNAPYGSRIITPSPPVLFSESERGSMVRSIGFANSTEVLVYNYNVNGKRHNLFLIRTRSIGSGEGEYFVLELLVLNTDVVDEGIAHDIAKTFRRGRSPSTDENN